MKRRWTKAQRRALLVLLTGASNLSGIPLTRAAQVRSGTLHPFLARLENCGWVTSEWEHRTDRQDRRRFYSLTPLGRREALGVLGLEESETTTGAVRP